MNWLRMIVMDLALRVDALAFRWLAADPDSPISWRDHLRWMIEDRAMALWIMAYDGSQEELEDAFQFDWEYLNARQREHYRASTWSLELYRGSGKGNFRFKANLERSHSLLHLEIANSLEFADRGSR